MLLCEATINSTLHRISNQTINTTTHLWKALIKDADHIAYTTGDILGGYARMVAGDITFSIDLFDNHWPPPKQILIKLMATETTEEAAITFFDGLAIRNGFDRNGVKYSPYDTDEYDVFLTEPILAIDDLEEIFTTFCGASYLNLTLNTDNIRADGTWNNLYRWVPSGYSVLKMLHEFAVDTNHLFYIEESTLYLVDMFTDNGDDITANEFDYKPVAYLEIPQYRAIVANSSVFNGYTFPTDYNESGTSAVGDIFNTDILRSMTYASFSSQDAPSDGKLAMAHTSLIPYDSSKTYAFKIRYATSTEAGAYTRLGLMGVASDKSTLVNVSGVDSYTSQHYAAVNKVIGTGYKFRDDTGYVSGSSATGSSGPDNDPASPGAMHTDVAYIRPIVVFNDVSGTGKFLIDYVQIYESNASGDFNLELFFEDFTAGNFNSWDIYYEGDADKSVNVGTPSTLGKIHMPNIKTIIESPRAELSLPLNIANLVKHGQKINFTDATTPPGTNTITGAIRARTIKYDLFEDNIIVSGEGAIT